MKSRLPNEPDEQPDKEFASRMKGSGRPSLIAELWEFIGVNRKWWLAPIIAMLLLIGALAALAGSAVAPFIYTLF